LSFLKIDDFIVTSACNLFQVSLPDSRAACIKVEDAKWFLILASKALRTSALLPVDLFIYQLFL